MSRVLTVWSCACFGSLLMAVAMHGAEPALRWVRNLDDAKRIAAAENKDLFINFTGLEWCGVCRRLHNRVLSKKEFAPVANDFVLVDLDFPSDDDDLGELKESYAAWQKQYLIRGFPTVILAESTGRPYASVFGCDAEVEVSEYIGRLRAFQKARRMRDAELAAAETITGPARAQKLHAAIQSIADAIGGIEEFKDDPILVFYRNEVDEIRRIDADNSLMLRAVYDSRFAARQAYVRWECILSQFDKYQTKEDFPAAIAHIDKLLGDITDGKVRFQILKLRCDYLEFSEQYTDALAAVRRLQKDPNCPARDRNDLFRDEAHYLCALDRLDDAIACFDRQIASAEDRPNDRFYFMNRGVNSQSQQSGSNTSVGVR